MRGFPRLLGKKIRAPAKLDYVRDMSPSKKRPHDEVFEDGAEKRLKMMQEATKNQARKTAQNKRYYDARTNAQDSLVQSGDLVLVKQSQLSNKMHGRLAPKFHGPYAVVDIDGSIATVSAQGKKAKLHADNLKKYYPRNGSKTPAKGKK